jgi:hypothetical protein
VHQVGTLGWYTVTFVADPKLVEPFLATCNPKFAMTCPEREDPAAPARIALVDGT